MLSMTSSAVVVQRCDFGALDVQVLIQTKRKRKSHWLLRKGWLSVLESGAPVWEKPQPIDPGFLDCGCGEQTRTVFPY